MSLGMLCSYSGNMVTIDILWNTVCETLLQYWIWCYVKKNKKFYYGVNLVYNRLYNVTVKKY